MAYFGAEQLSKNQVVTPEGWLVCMNCVIARTGFQDYDQSELDVPPGPDGKIRVYRDEAQVFSPETIASFEGKDITIEHPDADVNPENWKELSHGHIQNVRRGSGVESDLLLADLVFKTKTAIELIRANPVYEISCGYDARYEIRGPGDAAQVEIRGNHAAMVEQGRCGPVCATKDHLPQALKSSDTILSTGCNCGTATCGCGAAKRTKDSKMSMQDWIKGVRDAFATKDEKAIEEHMKSADNVMSLTGNPEDNETHTHVHLHLGEPKVTEPEGGLPSTGETEVASSRDDSHGAMFGGRTFFTDATTDAAFKDWAKGMTDSMKEMKDGFEEMKKAMEKKEETKDDDKARDAAVEEKTKEIEGELKEEAPAGTGDVKKHKDSAFLQESFAQTKSQAEILMPGIAIPTFDSAAAPVDGYGSICALRRKALKGFAMTKDGAEVLTGLTRTTDFDGATCREITPIFRAAVAIQTAKQSTADMRGFKDEDRADKPVTAARTLEDVQRANEQYWAEQAKRAE